MLGGNEIVPATRRMALMNLFLHNIGDFESDSFISPADSLISDTGTTGELKASYEKINGSDNFISARNAIFNECTKMFLMNCGQLWCQNKILYSVYGYYRSKVPDRFFIEPRF